MEKSQVVSKIRCNVCLDQLRIMIHVIYMKTTVRVSWRANKPSLIIRMLIHYYLICVNMHMKGYSCCEVLVSKLKTVGCLGCVIFCTISVTCNYAKYKFMIMVYKHNYIFSWCIIFKFLIEN